MSPTQALEYLRRNVDRLCKVRFAGSAALALKALAFYSALPAEDGDDMRDMWLEEVRIYAGQFPLCGRVAKRQAVTDAFMEVMVNGD